MFPSHDPYSNDPVFVLGEGVGHGEELTHPARTAAPKSLLAVSLMTVVPTTILPGVDKHSLNLLSQTSEHLSGLLPT